MDVRPHEQRLIDLADTFPTGRILCTTAGRGQHAAALAKRADRDVTCWLLDLYQAQQARQAIGCLPDNLLFACQADPPADELVAAALCFTKQGDAELVRETLQSAHERLAIGGRLVAAIDNLRDQWLHELLRTLFAKVTRQPHDDATVYLSTKTKLLKKLKNFACEFVFRDADRLIQLRTRPGVFSHRELDGGARALIKAMHIAPSSRVLDLGCGSGAVGIAAALRASTAQVHCTDSNPRAIEAVLWAAERNSVANLTAPLDCDGSSSTPGAFDLVLANPPYYSNFRLASLFVTIAHRALAPGGKLLVVTKTPDWYVENLAERFGNITPTPVGKYHVVTAIRA
jgi:16S rRNA (guanine1207-N2)-methyltransferase